MAASKFVKRILMCTPDHFTVDYVINVHMKKGVDSKKAMTQWLTLKKTLENCGAKIEVMKGVKGLPDMVFTANAAVVKGDRAYLAHFLYKQRQPERDHYKAALSSLGFTTVGSTEMPNEGAGDALWVKGDKKVLFAAHGLRTDYAVYADMVKELGGDVRLVNCELTDPRWYHIDTAFCPITKDWRKDVGIWYPYAFSEASRKRMENEMTLIPVTEKDALNFACNMVVVGGSCVLHAGSDDIVKRLEHQGHEVHPVDLSEFIKAGGSAKCLTLALDTPI